MILVEEVANVIDIGIGKISIFT